MKKILFFLGIISLLVLAACGGDEVVGKRVATPAITGNVVAETQPTSTPESSVSRPSSGINIETGKTAAQALQDIQAGKSITSDTINSNVPAKNIGNFYPPVTSDATGKDALKERTRALFTQPIGPLTTDADTQTGARYHAKDGDLINLPEKYGPGREE